MPTADIEGINELNIHGALLFHMPGTHFTTGCPGGPYLSMNRAQLHIATLKLPVSCSTN